MMETELNVAGMHCDGCEKSIVKALEAVPGVRRASASVDAGRVVVEHDGSPTIGALSDAIEDAGYDVIPARGRLPIVEP